MNHHKKTDSYIHRVISNVLERKSRMDVCRLLCITTGRFRWSTIAFALAKLYLFAALENAGNRWAAQPSPHHPSNEIDAENSTSNDRTDERTDCMCDDSLLGLFFCLCVVAYPVSCVCETLYATYYTYRETHTQLRAHQMSFHACSMHLQRAHTLTHRWNITFIHIWLVRFFSPFAWMQYPIISSHISTYVQYMPYEE